MMAFFGFFADRVGEGDSVSEVLELEQSIQLGNTVLSDNLPFGHCGMNH